MNFEKDLTIKELADKLNVTKQCIYYKLNNNDSLSKYVYKKDGKRFIEKNGLKLIKDSLKEIQSESPNNFENDNSIETNQLSKDLSNEINKLYENNIKNLNDLIEQLKTENKHLREETGRKDVIIDSILNESKEKNRLLENMQVLLKEQKTLLESYKEQKSKWKFWKK